MLQQPLPVISIKPQPVDQLSIHIAMHVMRTWMDDLEKVVILIVVVTTAITFTSSVLGLQQPTVISVCQNKACCQRWKLKTPLPDTLHDLIINNNNENQVTIDVSSCLGQCDKGPNLRIASGGTEVYCNGIDDPIGLITLLDDTLSMTVSSKLLAAVTVFEKAQTVTALEEKQRYTSSIIRVLDEDDAVRVSTANARARIYQAEITFELGNYQEAIDGITQSIQLLTIPALTTSKFHDVLLAKAYRVAADTYEKMGNYKAAMESIQSMAIKNVDLRTKVVKELERLQKLAASA